MFRSFALFSVDGLQIVPEQHCIDLENVIVSVDDEVLNNDVGFIAAAQRVTGAADEIQGALQIQLQRQRKGYRRQFAGFVIGVVSNLGKQFAVHVGLFINLGVLQAGFVDEFEQGLGKACIGVLQQFLQ